MMRSVSRAAAAGIGLPIAYNYAAERYAQMLLGSCATEQLWMQKLEGSVELEIKLQPFSPVAEIRGLLSPIVEKPRVAGAINHRAFTLIESPNFSEGVSHRTKARHQANNKAQLPPVMTLRTIEALPPLPSLASLLRGGSCFEDVRIFCRKTRAATNYFFAEPPDGFAASLVPGAAAAA